MKQSLLMAVFLFFTLCCRLALAQGQGGYGSGLASAVVTVVLWPCVVNVILVGVLAFLKEWAAIAAIGCAFFLSLLFCPVLGIAGLFLAVALPLIFTIILVCVVIYSLSRHGAFQAATSSNNVQAESQVPFDSSVSLGSAGLNMPGTAAQISADISGSDVEFQTLEARDIHRFIVTASAGQVRKAQSNHVAVNRFFNAIRYGQLPLVRKSLSVNPLLILTKDVYGNSPLDAARREDNAALVAFFKECLPVTAAVVSESPEVRRVLDNSPV